ncbi:hypothetical protein DNTS_030102 [Danionella cerebrum]|uniref:Mitochondrial import receptor subunit TOM20 homolog n=1 Tax=Danionella cerebrum TaxID=2873325 RepID=A0A553Q1U7_9TELE|nr:hypothetical protein DNTS_030102 [Danionella translucida]
MEKTRHFCSGTIRGGSGCDVTGSFLSCGSAEGHAVAVIAVIFFIFISNTITDCYAPCFDMMGGSSSRIAAGLGAALFVGYCIYFDRKRRSDPNYKNKLRERRRKQKAAQEKAGLSRLPDLKDAEAVQKFFLEEIQLGEELLAQGDYEKGVDHLTNAIAVCGQPQQLLQVLQQTLPPPVFQMLLTKLPSISQRIVSAQSISDDDDIE